MNSATAASTQEPTSATIKHVPRSGTVHTNGQELYYEIHGDGPPLVLVMGIGYDSSLWTLQQVPELSTRFQCRPPRQPRCRAQLPSRSPLHHRRHG